MAHIALDMDAGYAEAAIDLAVHHEYLQHVAHAVTGRIYDIDAQRSPAGYIMGDTAHLVEAAGLQLAIHIAQQLLYLIGPDIVTIRFQAESYSIRQQELPNQGSIAHIEVIAQ